MKEEQSPSASSKHANRLHASDSEHDADEEPLPLAQSSPMLGQAAAGIATPLATPADFTLGAQQTKL